MTYRCSIASEQREEGLVATASTVRYFMLIEDPGPWGPEILRSQRLPLALREALRHWQRELGVRPLLIRRPGRHHAGPRQVFVINARYGWCETMMTDDLGQLAELDLAGITGGAGVGLRPHHEPVLLVCTHGRHDACCAERGRPLAAELAERWPALTWESSHLGGDRFAANLMVMPDAHCYGRVTPEAGPDVVADHLAGLLSLANYRGHCTVPWPEQAAEFALRDRLGLRELGAVRVQRLRRDGTLFSVTLAAGGRTYRVDLRHGAKPAELLTCRSEEPSGAVQYHLVALTRLN